MKDKIIVITGGSKGLGKAMAKILVKAGAKVIITGLNKDILAKAAQETGAVAVVSDVTDQGASLKLAAKVVKDFGQIDVWINNAGTWMSHASIEDMDWDKVHDMMEVNLFGTIYGSKAAMIQMKQQQSGMIVNIISDSGLIGRAFSSGYCASKWAANGFTKSLRLALEEQGIKVIGIFPGGFQSEIFGDNKPEAFDDFMTADYVAQKVVDNMAKDKPEEEMVIKRG